MNSNTINSKSREKNNFRILKKNIIEKREEPLGLGIGSLGMIVVTGFGQHPQQQQTVLNSREGPQFPPRLRSNINMGNYR